VVDVNGDGSLAGDVFEYTIVVTNTGNDTAVRTVLSDALPPGVTYLRGSLAVSEGAGAGAKTDAAGDDQGDLTSDSQRITVRLGSGATPTAGGSLAPGESTSVRFSVTLDAEAPATIANQAQITSAGAMGAPPSTTPTDGNAQAPGSQSTPGCEAAVAAVPHRGPTIPAALRSRWEWRWPHCRAGGGAQHDAQSLSFDAFSR
jgi:uncharacterized repeat protein (TIGR01451 family)